MIFSKVSPQCKQFFLMKKQMVTCGIEIPELEMIEVKKKSHKFLVYAVFACQYLKNKLQKQTKSCFLKANGSIHTEILCYISFPLILQVLEPFFYYIINKFKTD